MLPEWGKRAYLALLAAECQAAPLLVILFDLHWGGELTVALFDQALRDLRDLRDPPLFVLALARPELHTTHPALWSGHKPQQIELKGLGQRACERLIQQALGKQVDAETAAWMVEQSAGNALFLEELIRAAAEGQLDRKPDTVIAMLQARIGHLGACTKSEDADRADRLRHARIDYSCGRQHFYAGQTRLAIPHLQRTLPVGREFQEQELILLPSIALGLALCTQGMVNKAIALLEPVSVSMERLFGKDLDTVRAYLYLTASLGLAGNHEAVARIVDHVRPWVEEIQQPLFGCPGAKRSRPS